MKKILAFLLSVIMVISMLFSLVACSTDNTPNTQETSTDIQQTETNNVSESDTAGNFTPTVTTITEVITSVPEISEGNEMISEPVFRTDNITRIAFSINYGYGDECEVPEQYMTEIINWLGTFTVDEEISGDVPIPPGTGFYYVHIWYSDATEVQNNLSTINIDGITYYMSSAKTPECFMEILSQSN